MRIMSIASGSSGNSTYIGTDSTTVILDCGISMKRIISGIEGIGLSGGDIDAILITHEHYDHIKSLGVLARKLSVPIYATAGTIDSIIMGGTLGTFDHNLFVPIDNDERFNIGDISVKACSISHDAYDPVCYSFSSGSSKVAVATDMGIYDSGVVEQLSNCDAMIVEANHDIRMLEVGPYPFPLKKRILSDRGHLCNEAGGQLIRKVLNDHIKYIALGHLSDKNNYPDLAYETVRQELADNPYTSDVRDFGLTVASRDETGELIEV